MLITGAMKLPIHIRSKTGSVQAYCPNLPGCSAAARTEEEALRLLRERINAHFAAATRGPIPGTRIVQLEV